MENKRRFLGIVGSYRKGGVIDTVVSEVLDAAKQKGAITSKIYLSDCNINFCTNCRECTQPPGSDRVPCVVNTDDDMNAIVDQIEASDTVVIGAPVNIGSANAMTQKFVERCVGYYYFPWGAKYPVLRDKRKRRKAILVCGSAAPAFLNRGFFGSSATMTLKEIAKLIGADVVQTIKVGEVISRDFRVPDRSLKKARRAAQMLAA
jgi:NAD(P)H-dependent FMN reductase